MDAKRKAEKSLLKMIEDTPYPAFLPITAENEALIMRLKDENLFSGWRAATETGDEFCECALTASGRALLRELEREAEEETSIGLLKKQRFAIYKWVLGIISTIVSALVVVWLTKLLWK